MKGIVARPVRFVGVVLSMFAAVQLSACTGETQKPLGKAATELTELLESNPQVRDMLAASIEKAKQANPDRNSNPVRSVEEYLEFVSWAETAMQAIRSKSETSKVTASKSSPS